ncbi:MAG: hypothetical protein ACYDEY_16705 [Acidimicrobiales bacterium]
MNISIRGKRGGSPVHIAKDEDAEVKRLGSKSQKMFRELPA